MAKIARDGGPTGYASGDPFDVQDSRYYGPEDEQPKYRLRGNDKAEDVDQDGGKPVSMDWADVGEMLQLASLIEIDDGRVVNEQGIEMVPVMTDGFELWAVDTHEGDPPMDKYEFMGFPIVVENSKGSNRVWYDKHNDEEGRTKMHFDYGYIDGAIGADGEEVDVYIGPKDDVDFVYVVHQMKAPDFTEYDEDKVMLGFDSEEAAKTAYIKQYNDEKFYGGMSSMPVETFRQKIDSGNSKKITNNKKANAMQTPITTENVGQSLAADLDALDTAITNNKPTLAKKLAGLILAANYPADEMVAQEPRLLHLIAASDDIKDGSTVEVETTGREGKVSEELGGDLVSVDFTDGQNPASGNFLLTELEKSSKKLPHGLTVLANMTKRVLAERNRDPRQMPQPVIDDAVRRLQEDAHSRELSNEEEANLNLLLLEDETRGLAVETKTAGINDLLAEAPSSKGEELDIDFFSEPSEEGAVNSIASLAVNRLTEARPRLLANKSALLLAAADSYRKTLASLKAPFRTEHVSVERIEPTTVAEDGTMIKGAIHFHVILCSSLHRRRAAMTLVMPVIGGEPIEAFKMITSGGEELPFNLESVDRIMGVRRENTRPVMRNTRVVRSFHQE